MLWRISKTAARAVAAIATLMSLIGCLDASPEPDAARDQSIGNEARPTHQEVPPSPFLASHESRAVPAPEAADVAPGVHIELERLRQYAAEHPNDTDAQLKLAQMLQDSHKDEEAVAAYRVYLRAVPDSREAWLDLSKAYAALGQWESALTACDSLLARRPDDPSGLYNKGAVLANLGRPADAREFWTRAAGQNEDAGIKRMAELAMSRLRE